MLDALFAIALACCWILGFFVSAQFLYQQHKIHRHVLSVAKELEELRKGGD